MSKDTASKINDLFPFFLMGCLFVLIYSLALLVSRPFEEAGMVVFENPEDPLNLVYFFLTLMLFTIVILLVAKFWKKQLIQVIVLGAIGFTIFYVFYPLLIIYISEVWSLLFSITTVATLVIILVKHPEWYVIDVCGIIVGAGSTAMLGISLNILLSIAFLIALAVYDAISVYKTKHMIDLADTILDLKLPIILVIPKIREYSLIKESKRLKEKLEDEEERNAFFIGLGDFIIPGILVVSVFHNAVTKGLLLALSVIFGTLLGFAVLMASVIKGKPQAGLPCLCGGAILAYLVSSYILFGELAGLTFPV
jgi:presenilin-like A22 family membrane protease